MNIDQFLVKENASFTLSDIDPEDTGKYDSKEKVAKQLAENIEKIEELQGMLYAQNKYAVLIIFQAMDTAGKDGCIKHVMSGLNPQATQVHAFKKPSEEDLDHDYLWRVNKNLPERGRIGIFNRSHYEEVLVVRVHNLIKNQQIPAEFINEKIWEARFKQIENFERYLFENGIITIKFFLHISKDEQKKRLLARIDDKSKNWKFAAADIEERQYWDEYQKCYQEAIQKTSTGPAPWYVIPSNKKWYARLAVSEVIVKTMEKMDLHYPLLGTEQESVLKECKKKLLNE